MRRLFPNPFGRREWWLTALAVVMAAATGCYTFAAGMGAGVVILFCIGIGTLFMILVAGDERCFFTALFTGVLIGGLLLAGFVHLIFIQRESFSWVDTIMVPLFCSGFVIVPTTFAWLVTYIRQIIKRRR